MEIQRASDFPAGGGGFRQCTMKHTNGAGGGKEKDSDVERGCDKRGAIAKAYVLRNVGKPADAAAATGFLRRGHPNELVCKACSRCASQRHRQARGRRARRRCRAPAQGQRQRTPAAPWTPPAAGARSLLWPPRCTVKLPSASRACPSTADSPSPFGTEVLGRRRRVEGSDRGWGTAGAKPEAMPYKPPPQNASHISEQWQT